jgi:hypothetical protein
VFEDHAFKQRLDDLLFFWCELGDGFKLEAKIAIRAARKINTSALPAERQRAVESRRAWAETPRSHSART